MKTVLMTFLALASLVGCTAQPEIISVQKIWDRGAHNAFTDLIRFQNRWFCCFREAEAHVGGDGELRILQSADGEYWQPAALLAETGIDLRDPKLSITPDGQLMLVAGGSVYRGTKQLQGAQPRVAFSKDGRDWSLPRQVLEDGEWLWRVTWHEGQAYGVSYHVALRQPDSRPPLQLFCSANGTDWKSIAAFTLTGFPNEATLRFQRDGTALMLVRRDASDQGGWIGSSRSPYSDWKFTPTTVRIGGPNFIELPDGTLVASGRDYAAGKATCALFEMTPDSLKSVLALPSGGDCSYPGLVWHDGLLWVSYYSSHEGKSSIYLAKVKWPLR